MSNFTEMNCYLLVFVALCGTYLTTGQDLYCWSGHDTTISNQSCTVNSTMTTANQTTTNNTSNDQAVTFCYEIIYRDDDDDNSTLNFEKNPISARTMHRNVTCDFSGLCNDSLAGKAVQTTVNGIEATLMCCKGDNCNKNPHIAPIIKPVCNHINYNGSVAIGHKETCASADDLCMSITVYKDGGIQNQKLQCGNKQQCNTKSHKISPTPICVNQTEKGQKVEICCCSGDLCIPMPANITVLKPKDNNDTDSPLDNIIHHKVPSKSKGGPDWLFVGGIISAAVLVVVVITSVVVIWQVRKRKQAKSRNRMLFSYTPISASEVDDDDIQMLL